jgi:hypothetical protein
MEKKRQGEGGGAVRDCCYKGEATFWRKFVNQFWGELQGIDTRP